MGGWAWFAHICNMSFNKDDKNKNNMPAPVGSDSNEQTAEAKSVDSEKQSDEVSQVLTQMEEKAGKKEKQNFSSNKNNPDAKKGRESKNSFNPDKRTNPNKDAQKVASSTTPTISNGQSNWSTSELRKFASKGYVDSYSSTNVAIDIDKIFKDLGLVNEGILSRRGELFSTFNRWSALRKARVSKAEEVFVLDGPNSEKGVSTDSLWSNVHRWKAPFKKMIKSVPIVNTRVAPDIIYGLKLLNLSGATYQTNASQNFKLSGTYGELDQDLTNKYGYQTRKITVKKGSSVNVTPGYLYSYRYNSKNKNGIGKHTVEDVAKMSGTNELHPWFFRYCVGGNAMLSEEFALSKEAYSKARSVRALYNAIKKEANDYSRKAKSGDNNWLSPLHQLLGEDALAVTLNAVSDLKTFFYIMHDALNNAFKSQFLIATKVGTPDSTAITFDEKSLSRKQWFDAEFQEIWSALEFAPMNKPVIDQWNKFKQWSKFKDTDLYDNDNSLMIPVFLLMKSGGGYYSDDGTLSDSNPTDPVKMISTSDTTVDFKEKLIKSVQIADKTNLIIPHGDWLAMFFKTVLSRLSIDSITRLGSSNEKTPSSGDVLKGTNGAILDYDDYITKSINAAPTSAPVTNGVMYAGMSDNANRNPVNPYVYDDTATSVENVDALNLNKPINFKKDPNNPDGDTWKANLFGDMIVSNHTVTGFMSAFMQIMYSMSMSGELRDWKEAFNDVSDYFARLSGLKVPGNTFFQFGSVIPTLNTSERSTYDTTQPAYNREQNIDFFHSNRQYSKDGFTYRSARGNYVDSDTWSAYSRFPYKLAGVRYSIIDKNGKADRDVYSDNTYLCVKTNGDKVNNFFGESIDRHNHYYATSSILRIEYTNDILFGSGKDKILGYVLINNHVGLGFCKGTTVFVKGNADVRTGLLSDRSLIVNSSDGINASYYYGAFDHLSYASLFDNYLAFLKETGCPVINTRYLPTSLLPSTAVNTIDLAYLIQTYKLNGRIEIIDKFNEQVFGDFSVDSEDPSTKTFSLI